jgi:methyltransferase
MTSDTVNALLVLVVVGAFLGAEAIWSRRNEERLRARGALEPPGDVYPAMQIAYPAAFIAMAFEGAVAGVASGPLWIAGLGLFAASKALKYWAIATLGDRWSFRVLVIPGEPLVASGPYRLLRHPNYVAVMGELASVAVMMAAPLSGSMALAGFGGLMLARVRVEERALGIRR